MTAIWCFFGGMKTLTIRGVPDDLHARLKGRAKKNRRSLNQEVIAELSDISPSGPVDEATRREQRAQEMIDMVEAMRGGMTRFMTAEEIDEAKREGRR